MLDHALKEPGPTFHFLHHR